MFTGGVENGRQVLAALGRRGIPALAELSGFDPAIVLADAPMEITVRALTWAAFVGCGQTCVAVKRVYVVGDPAPWAEALAAAARALRVGDPAVAGDRRRADDLGEGPRAVPRDDPGGDRRRVPRVLAGGHPLDGPGSFYPADRAARRFARGGGCPGRRLRTGRHRPRRRRPSPRPSPPPIGARSRWRPASGAATHGQARQRGRQLQAGMVTINDAVTPTAHAAAPFGGVKASGYRPDQGPDRDSREFAQPQVVFARSAGGFRPQLFPYPSSVLLERFLSVYRSIFHASR